MDDSIRLTTGKIIDKRWKIEKFLGEGHFHSAFYEVSDIQRPIRLYSLKVESNAQKPDDPPKFLVLEKKLMKALKDNNARHFPGVESWGENEKFKYLVIGLVGKNLNEMLAELPESRFTLRTALHVAQQTLLGIEELHYCGFLHRNIKPANMCTGIPPIELKRVFLINFELCRMYVGPDGHLLSPRQKPMFRGSPRYASVQALEEHEQGRVDDMWSWLFSIMEMILGKLPWDNADQPSPATDRMVWLANKKKELIDNQALFLAGCPREFSKILDHVKHLKFVDAPDYMLIMNCLNETIERKHYTDDILLDWESEPKSMRPKSAKSHQ